MEAKHFTHNHNLVFHQLPQGTEIKCSGCQSQGTDNVYACWQCNYFLHEQCFRATRSLKTPSHPLHSLTLLPYPTHHSGSFYCDICKQIGSGLTYCCAECDFDLHVHCALSTTQPFPSSYPNPGFNTQPGTYPPLPPNNYPIHNNPDVHFTPPTIPGAINQVQNPNYPPQNNQAVPPPLSYPVPPPNYPVQSNHPTPPPSFSGHPPNFPVQNHTNPIFPSPPAPTPPAGFPVVNNQPNFPSSAPTPPAGFPVVNIQANFPSSAPTPPAGFPVVNNQANFPSSAPTPPAGFPVVNNQPGPSNQSSQNNTIPVFPASNATLNIPLKPSNQPTINQIRHFSHPHALKELEFTTQDPKKCYGCGFNIDGAGYTCVDLQCNFYLEKSCFEAPMEVKHKSHLDHPLKLLARPAYEGGAFTCNACIKEGTDFVYNCDTCKFDLHVDCVTWPERVQREDHEHPLTLFFSSPIPPKTEGQPEVTTICDVCRTEIHEMAWTYSCHECEFATHLPCIIRQAEAPEKSQEDLINEAALKLKVLQLLLTGRVDIIS